MLKKHKKKYEVQRIRQFFSDFSRILVSSSTALDFYQSEHSPTVLSAQIHVSFASILIGHDFAAAIPFRKLGGLVEVLPTSGILFLIIVQCSIRRPACLLYLADGKV